MVPGKQLRRVGRRAFADLKLLLDAHRRPSTSAQELLSYPYRELLLRSDIPYQHYRWGVISAAATAVGLHYPQIAVIELGVAGGNGLLALEAHANEIAELSGVAIDIYGFDTGSGLPPPLDYRDLPHLWREGYFGMDTAALGSRLSSARLVLGPIEDTASEFLASSPAPVGFVAFDMDLYSSTKAALPLLAANERLLLPRVVCYFDDIVGFSHNDYVGERLAISEFNEESTERKLAPIPGLRHVLALDHVWTEMTYLLHCFDHPRYCDFDGMNPMRELPLR